VYTIWSPKADRPVCSTRCVYYKAETLLNARTLQPAIATIYSDERGRTKLRTTRFTSGDVRIQPKANVPAEKHDAGAFAGSLSAISVCARCR
jgi:hypothetical protein